MRALLTVLEAKREEFVDDALIHAKSLCEELLISFDPQDESEGSIYLAMEASPNEIRARLFRDEEESISNSSHTEEDIEVLKENL
ncbi:hypothetical protein TNCV_1337421 [Trichonephila clavipes]|nr:hypothetical protein TNCV_1337421 [Trichonephila clavipes]